MPSTLFVSRAIDINAPAYKVYNHTSHLPDWKLWLEGYDSTTAKLMKDATGKTAQLKMNRTTVTVIQSTPRNIQMIWQTGPATPLPAIFDIISHKSSSTTTFHWQFNQKLKWYPWEKFAAIASDKTMGPFMEKSMENLKKLCESELR
jgi:hypothetical protein